MCTCCSVDICKQLRQCTRICNTHASSCGCRHIISYFFNCTVKTTQSFLYWCLHVSLGVVLEPLLLANWVVFVQRGQPAIFYVVGQGRFIACSRIRIMGGWAKVGRRAFVTVPFSILVEWRCVWTRVGTWRCLNCLYDKYTGHNADLQTHLSLQFSFVLIHWTNTSICIQLVGQCSSSYNITIFTIYKWRTHLSH